MKAVELQKAYDPKDFEERIYQEWLDKGLFSPQDNNNEHYSIVMPPPNVTGILHMGHALNNSLQDILIRYYRMTGAPTLWVPGTDHAGIATQSVVEKQLLKEGKKRQDLGREKFLERTWDVKDKHHGIIKKQLETIGASCDWSRERFTMDEGLSKAVRECFVTLYERGLIYKGEYLVNYCPHCGTALADDEVEHEETPGKLYEITYPYTDGSGSITIATTRPETMFGDIAVAVNPEDERYKHLVGKKVKLPLTDREIPIIQDSFVSLEFGTGMVKITPAHDPNDWECGKRHDLEIINVLNPDGTLNDNCPEKYRNIQAAEARKLVVEDLKELGNLISEKEHNHEVGHCYRCNTIIEPYLSKQWFVSMQSMADKALQAWKDEKIKFYPKRWENTYSHWLTSIRDWCISRQLWWGHRIPVWYCEDCGNMMVLREDPCECDKCKSKNINQESDVLDTWFSSWLWPFSTLGWPEKTPDFDKYFPTTSLVTGYDIIFFWVARMIMASLEFVGEVPFRDIYLTGLVRDKQGRKMSKTLGNGIDPIDVVNQYGADAMKFTLSYMATQGQDILIDMNSFKLGSRFANKVWNATRFLLMNLEDRNLIDVKDIELDTMDKWIYNSLNEASQKVEISMKNYRFNDGASAIYDFFWNDFCDWYVESSKQKLYSDDNIVKDKAISILLDLLAESMRLMHPFLSFLTEEIYSKLPNVNDQLINSKYPKYSEDRNYELETKIVNCMQDAVRGVRALRADLQIAVDKKIKVIIKTDKDFIATNFFKEKNALLMNFMNANSLEIDDSNSLDTSKAVPVAGSGFESFVFVREAIDIEKEISKLEKEIQAAQKNLEGTLRKLSNEKFLANAAQVAIDKENSKKAEFEEKIEKSTKHIELLKTL
ncbi:MAG: valine--tRNA ligase [Spirochaetia bacterium]|nr:valine--tRNA ligase [Spirochaetia bacterium]